MLKLGKRKIGENGREIKRLLGWVPIRISSRHYVWCAVCCVHISGVSPFSCCEKVVSQRFTHAIPCGQDLQQAESKVTMDLSLQLDFNVEVEFQS